MQPYEASSEAEDELAVCCVEEPECSCEASCSRCRSVKGMPSRSQRSAACSRMAFIGAEERDRREEEERCSDSSEA